MKILSRERRAALPARSRCVLSLDRVIQPSIKGKYEGEILRNEKCLLFMPISLFRKRVLVSKLNVGIRFLYPQYDLFYDNLIFGENGSEFKKNLAPAANDN